MKAVFITIIALSILLAFIYMSLGIVPEEILSNVNLSKYNSLVVMSTFFLAILAAIRLAYMGLKKKFEEVKESLPK